MTVDDLLAYIRDKMSMQHVYQPVLIRALVDAGGVATSRQLAMAYLVEDEEVVEVAEERLRRMLLPVLKNIGVMSTEPDGIVRLNAPNLPVQDRERVRLACEERLRAFVVTRDFWAESVVTMPSATPRAVSKAADFRCLACRDITRPLQVEHIVPKSKGGTNMVTSLQALCDSCTSAGAITTGSTFGSASHRTGRRRPWPE